MNLPIIHFQKDDILPIDFDHSPLHCGFCNKSSWFYTHQSSNIILIIDKVTQEQKYIFTLPSPILSISSIDTQSSSALIVAMTDSVAIVNLLFGDVLSFPFPCASKIFTEFAMDLNENYFHFVVATEPLGLYLVKCSVFMREKCPLVQKKSYKAFCECCENACLLDITLSTMCSKNKFVSFAHLASVAQNVGNNIRETFARYTVMNNNNNNENNNNNFRETLAHVVNGSFNQKEPFVECSETGIKPYTKVMFLDQFVPLFVSLSEVNEELIVVVGGNGALFFGYNSTTNELLFSHQLPIDEDVSSVERILYNLDRSKSDEFVIPIISCEKRTIVAFYQIERMNTLDNKEIVNGIRFITSAVLNDTKYLAANVHHGNHSIMSMLFFGKENKTVYQALFEIDGRKISIDQLKDIELQQPIHKYQQQTIVNEYKCYEEYIENVYDCYLPSYISLIDKNGWSEIICSSVVFEEFIQAIRLLPTLILRRYQPEYLEFYNKTIAKGFGLPQYAETNKFIVDSLKFLMLTNNISLLIEDMDGDYQDVRPLQIIEEYFRSSYEIIVKEFTTKVYSKQKINSLFMKEVEEQLEIIKAIFTKVNVDYQLIEQVEQNLYAIRYFTPFIHLFDELNKEPVIIVDGTTINPCINVFMEGYKHPISITSLLIHLFNTPICPPYQIYLTYLFIIHGLVDSIHLIPSFDELPEIPDIATLLMYFDSENLSMFFEELRINKAAQEVFIIDILPTIFNYYSESTLTPPPQRFTELISLIKTEETLLQYFSVLIAHNEFVETINELVEFSSMRKLSDEDFRTLLNGVFNIVIKKNKLSLFFEKIYNTIYEHHFMNFVFMSGNDSDLIKVLHFYMNINDIYSTALVYKHFEENIWNDNEMALNVIRNMFDQFLSQKSSVERGQIDMLQKQKKFLQTFIEGEKELTLEFCLANKLEEK